MDGGNEQRRDGPVPIEDIADPDPVALDLWGCVAVNCTLSPDDRKDDVSKELKDASCVCAFMVPSQGFLFFHLNTVKERFSRLVKAEQYIWFSEEIALPSKDGIQGQKEIIAVPWQYPISVVFDLLRSRDETSFARNKPLSLTVHFTPDATSKLFFSVFPFRTDAREQDAWRLYDHLLKRSVALRYGTAAPLEKLRSQYPEHSENLFRGLKACDGLQFHRGRMALLSVGDREGMEASYPVVIHMKGKTQNHKVPQSKRTFGQMLHHCVPVDRFRLLTADDWSSPVQPKDVTIQGVTPLYNTPMEVLMEVLVSTDLSLHVVVKC